MTSDTFDQTLMKQELTSDEGNVPTVYQDSEGYATIGIGCCVDKRIAGAGLCPAAIQAQLEFNIAEKAQHLDSMLPWWRTLDPVRQRALLNMTFQMGIGKVLGFKNMLSAIRRKDWAKAHDECLDSLYGRRTPQRAKRVANMLLTGVSSYEAAK